MNLGKEDTFLNGIDISHWQKEIDWPAAVNDTTVKFVIAKATEGATWQDPKFHSNWQAMKQHGVPIIGAYHYFRGTSLPADQANNIVTQLKQVGFNHADDLFSINVAKQDRLNPSEVADYLLWIMSNLTSPIIQEKVIIYTSPDWWNSHVQDLGHRLSQHPLWVAHWTTAAQPRLPDGWSDWMIWHHSRQGSVSGIQGSVDLNRMKIKLNTTQAVTPHAILKVHTGVADDVQGDELTTDTTTAAVSVSTKASVTSSIYQNTSLFNGLKSLQSTLKNVVDTLLLPPIDRELEETLKEGRQLMNKSEKLIQNVASSENFTNQNFSNFSSDHNLLQPNASFPVNQSLPALTTLH